MWRIAVQIVVEENGWTSSIGIPMFQLDGDYLGIVNEDHAISIAKKIVDPLHVADEIHVCAVKV